MDESLILAEDSVHYLTHVIRVAKGQEIETFDGSGTIDRWEITGMSRIEIKLRHIKRERLKRQSPINLTLGLNPLKSGKEETAVRMAAAMEVREIQPVIFKRSDIPFDLDRLMNRVDRWKKLCVGDVSASGGGYLPDILDPVTLPAFLESKMHGVIFYEEAPSENKTNAVKFQKGKKYCALVGPEGGIEREEVELAKQNGLDVASLGPWILKAELAGVLAPMWVYERVG